MNTNLGITLAIHFTLFLYALIFITCLLDVRAVFVDRFRLKPDILGLADRWKGARWKQKFSGRGYSNDSKSHSIKRRSFDILTACGKRLSTVGCGLHNHQFSTGSIPSFGRNPDQAWGRLPITFTLGANQPHLIKKLTMLVSPKVGNLD